MSNMSYCRFENTYSDLKDCYNNINENLRGMSKSELKYRDKLIQLCQDILDEAVESSGLGIEEDEEG